MLEEHILCIQAALSTETWDRVGEEEGTGDPGLTSVKSMSAQLWSGYHRRSVCVGGSAGGDLEESPHFPLQAAGQ